LEPLVGVLKRPDAQEKLLETAAWTASNLCRHKNPPPSTTTAVQLIPALALLLHSENKSVISDVCWAFSYLSDGSNDRIELVVKSGVLPRLVQLLKSGDIRFVAPALRTVGNIATGDDNQTQAILEAGDLLPALKPLLDWNKAQIVKETCWTLSNVAAGNPAQIQMLIDADVLPGVMNILATAEFRIKGEAMWVVANILSGGSQSQIEHLIRLGALPKLCTMLSTKDVKSVLVVLESIAAILSFADKMGCLEEATICVEECGGLDLIEKLQESESEDVYRHAVAIIEKYFDAGEEETPKAKDTIETAAQPGQQFSF
jgi:importin subunit alpha-2